MRPLCQLCKKRTGATYYVLLPARPVAERVSQGPQGGVHTPRLCEDCRAFAEKDLQARGARYKMFKRQA